MEPTPQEALKTLAVAAYEYRGTRAQHEVIAQAVQILTEHLNPPDELVVPNGQSARKTKQEQPSG